MLFNLLGGVANYFAQMVKRVSFSSAGMVKCFVFKLKYGGMS